MPKWLAVAHVVVEATTKEEANRLIATELAAHLPTPEGGEDKAVQTPRYTVINVERIPDYTDGSRQPHG